MSDVLTITVDALSCTLAFNAGIDFSTHTQKYAIDSNNDLSIYSAFSDYSTCAVLAYPVLASDGTSSVSEFSGDSSTGSL